VADKPCIKQIYTRYRRISDIAIRIWSDFHYPVKSDSSRIACFTPDQTGANSASTSVRQSGHAASQLTDRC